MNLSLSLSLALSLSIYIYIYTYSYASQIIQTESQMQSQVMLVKTTWLGRGWGMMPTVLQTVAMLGFSGGGEMVSRKTHGELMITDVRIYTDTGNMNKHGESKTSKMGGGGM